MIWHNSVFMLPLLYGRPVYVTESLGRMFAKSANSTRIILPPFPESEKLFDCYLEHVDTLQHIIHIPTTRILLQKTYNDIKQGLEVQLIN